MAKGKSTKDTKVPAISPEELAKREAAKFKTNERAKARRMALKAIKDMRDEARDKAATSAFTEDAAMLTEAKALVAQADAAESALNTRSTLWEKMPDGRWTRTIDLGEGNSINAKLEVADANGWLSGMAALTVANSVLMTVTGFAADVETAKSRFNTMISALRAVARSIK